MLDTVRKALAGVLLTGAFIGLLPLLPSAFGFRSAAVTNDTAGTYFPAASGTPSSRYITCSQFQGTYQLRRNRTYTGNFFQCTNNWNSSVSLDLSLVNGNFLINAYTAGSTVTIPAGGSACVGATLKAESALGGPGTVVYRITANAANPAADLYAQLDFTGQIEVININPTHTYCP